MNIKLTANTVAKLRFLIVRAGSAEWASLILFIAQSINNAVDNFNYVQITPTRTCQAVSSVINIE